MKTAKFKIKDSTIQYFEKILEDKRFRLKRAIKEDGPYSEVMELQVDVNDFAEAIRVLKARNQDEPIFSTPELEI